MSGTSRGPSAPKGDQATPDKLQKTRQRVADVAAERQIHTTSARLQALYSQGGDDAQRAAGGAHQREHQKTQQASGPHPTRPREEGNDPRSNGPEMSGGAVRGKAGARDYRQLAAEAQTQQQGQGQTKGKGPSIS